MAAPVLVLMGTADPDSPDPAADADWGVTLLIHAEGTRAGRLLIESASQYPQAQEPETANPALIAFARMVRPDV